MALICQIATVKLKVSVHVNAPDDIYLTVAYHQKYIKDGEFKLRTLENQIFHITDL